MVALRCAVLCKPRFSPRGVVAVASPSLMRSEELNKCHLCVLYIVQYTSRTSGLSVAASAGENEWKKKKALRNTEENAAVGGRTPRPEQAGAEENSAGRERSPLSSRWGNE